jgi:outer membrane protein OmpA-like peptidoglycan-associated protein
MRWTSRCFIGAFFGALLPLTFLAPPSEAVASDKTFLFYGCDGPDSLHVDFSWEGLSPLTFTSTHKFNSQGGEFRGRAHFAISSFYYEDSMTSEELTIPRSVIDNIMSTLRSTPIGKTDHIRRTAWTDVFTQYEFTLKVCSRTITYRIKTITPENRIWTAVIAGREYYVNSLGPERALQLMLPYMSNEIFWKMKEKALGHAKVRNVLSYKLKKAHTPFSTVHFDTNKHDLKEQFIQVVYEIAKHIRAKRNIEVLVAGHCDERGSNEYNFALGGMRAESIIQHLANLGVNSINIHPVSYGEEQPKAKGHNEEAWRQNRRVEFYIYDWGDKAYALMR